MQDAVINSFNFTLLPSLRSNLWTTEALGNTSPSEEFVFELHFPTDKHVQQLPKKKQCFIKGITGKNFFLPKIYGWQQLVNWFISRNAVSSKIERNLRQKINQNQVHSNRPVILPSEPTICLRRAATCPWREEINSACCTLDAAKHKRKCQKGQLSFFLVDQIAQKNN